MWSVSDELKKFNALALLDEEKELILGKNLKDFLSNQKMEYLNLEFFQNLLTKIY